MSFEPKSLKAKRLSIIDQVCAQPENRRASSKEVLTRKAHEIPSSLSQWTLGVELLVCPATHSALPEGIAEWFLRLMKKTTTEPRDCFPASGRRTDEYLGLSSEFHPPRTALYDVAIAAP